MTQRAKLWPLQIQTPKGPQLIPVAGCQTRYWYAVQARHEKLVAYRFRERGIPTFLPLVTEVHKWSDRKKIVEQPMFSCYVFAKIEATNVDRLRLLRVDGVLSLVGKRGEGTPIPDEQIESVRILLAERMQWSSILF